MPPFHIEMRPYRLVGYACFVLFSAGAAGALWARQYWPALGLAAFALVGLFIVLGAGSFTIDVDRVTHKSWFGEWQIRWNEVIKAEFSASGTLLLIGSNKRFVLSPPSWWAGSQKELAASFVANQLQTRNVLPQLSRSADYKLMKNTRVRAA